MNKLKNYIRSSYTNLKLYNPCCKINSKTLPLGLKNNVDGLISEDSKILDLVYIKNLEKFNDLFEDEDEILFVINMKSINGILYKKKMAHIIVNICMINQHILKNI